MTGASAVTPFRWGIVGLGRIAQTEIAPAISRLPGHELRVVVSRVQARADDFAAAHGAARATTSYAGLLADDQVDAVYVATPNALHADQVVGAAEAGKHVLCDKPLALRADDARRAVAACRLAGVRLGMMFQSRRFEGVEEVATLVRSGTLGRPVLAQVEMGAGGRFPSGWRLDPAVAGLGTINNMGVHAFDLLRHLLGAEVTEVAAMVDQHEGGTLDTTAAVLLRFDNGAIAYVNANHPVRHPQDDVVVYGTEGRVAGRNTSRPGRRGRWVVTTDDGQQERGASSEDGYAATLEAFARAVRAGEDPIPSGDDGVRSVELTDAIVEALATSRVVRLPAPSTTAAPAASTAS